jgi:pimeloyl-ACP methyl ester carboxylesterase
MANKPIIHFVHGNSFPAGSYRQMFAQLEKHYDVQALEMHGHNPNYPVTHEWPHLVQELIDTLAQRYQQPVILVGHSLGGLLALMATHQRPDLIRCVVLIDSPIVAGWRAWFLGMLKLTGMIAKVSPSRFSEKRRTTWADLDEAYQHFSSKDKFAVWAPEVLQDYINAGMIAHTEGVSLKFNREIESKIYVTLPGKLGKVARQGLDVPVGFVGGTESIECRQGGLGAIKRLCGDNFVQLKAGHLLPMEIPQQTAQAIHEMILRLNPK